MLILCEMSLMDYLVEIDKLIFNSNFDEALTRIQKILDGIELTEKEKLGIKIIKCKALLGFGRYNEGLELTLEILNQKELKEYSLLELDIQIIYISFLDVFGRIDEILKQVYKGEQIIVSLDDKNSDDVILRKGNLQLQKGGVILAKGNKEDALIIFQSSLKYFEKIGNESKIAETYTLLAKTYAEMNKKDLALTYYTKSLDIQSEIQDLPGKANTLKEIGTFYLFKGMRTEALEYYQKSYDIYLTIGNCDFIGRLLNNFGIIHNFEGRLREAEDCYIRSLECQSEIGNKGLMARTYNNIGVLNIRMGDLEKAEEYIRKSLATFQELGNVQNIMNSFVQLGRIYNLKGQYDEALLNFQLSLNMMDQISSKGFIAILLYHYIATALLSNNLELAKEKLELLKQIDLESDEPLVHLRTRFATALLLMKSDRVRNRAKAEEYLEEVINSDIIEYDYKIDAMLNLCELKITVLRETNNTELLAEVKVLVNDILELSRNQHSMLIYAESYWLLSQIALIELNVRNAREYLTKAQNIAEEWGIKQLAMRISIDHDKLLERLELWEKLSTTNAQLPEIIETADIEEFFMKLYRDKGLDIQFPPEEPVMFMLLKSTGMPIYSKNFLLKEKLDDSLMSGFLSAINIFAKEAFSTKGPINRIKHNDYTIIINNIESYLLCYIFKGQSFSALQKLSKIDDKIKLNDQLWDELKLIYDRTITLSDENEKVLSSIIHDVMISSV